MNGAANSPHHVKGPFTANFARVVDNPNIASDRRSPSHEHSNDQRPLLLLDPPHTDRINDETTFLPNTSPPSSQALLVLGSSQ